MFEVYRHTDKATLYFGPDESESRRVLAANAPHALRLRDVEAPHGRPLARAPGASPAPVSRAKPILANSDLRAAGYTGDACQSCGGMQVVRNGTCLLCTTCGSTSGCS